MKNQPQMVKDYSKHLLRGSQKCCSVNKPKHNL